MRRNQGHASSVSFELSALNLSKKKRGASLIEVTGWFIQEHELRMPEKGASDTNASLHPLGELTEGTFYYLRELKTLNQLFRARQAPHRPEELDVLAHRELSVQKEMVGEKSDSVS
jgi:hypothetical protein